MSIFPLASRRAVQGPACRRAERHRDGRLPRRGRIACATLLDDGLRLSGAERVPRDLVNPEAWFAAQRQAVKRRLAGCARCRTANATFRCAPRPAGGHATGYSAHSWFSRCASGWAGQRHGRRRREHRWPRRSIPAGQPPKRAARSCGGHEVRGRWLEGRLQKRGSPADVAVFACPDYRGTHRHLLRLEDEYQQMLGRPNDSRQPASSATCCGWP
jgi:hypothetical protein